MVADLDYLRWAHERYGFTRLDLASSGVPLLPAEMLGEIVLDDLHAPRAFADAIADRYGLDSTEVLPALGASQALWLGCAALLEAGDDVLVETPTYEPLWRVPEGLGAKARFFERTAGRGWSVDPAAVRAKLTERTRMVVVSSPHNPTGMPIDSDTLRELARACADVGAALLVDEVYADFLPGPPRSARSVGKNVVAISSLTKRWGLGWSRSGWLAASPDVIARAQVAVRHATAQNGTAHAAVGLAALRHLGALTARADAAIAGGADLVDAWVTDHPRLSWTRPPGGPFGLVRVHDLPDLRPRLDALAAAHGLLVAPGDFFGAPDALRIGWTTGPTTLTEGLALLGAQL